MTVKSTEDMQESVKRFVEELQKRICIMKSKSVKANLHPEKLDEIEQILHKYIASSSMLTTKDILKISYEDMMRLTRLIPWNDIEIKNINRKFKENVKKANLISSLELDEELRTYFETIQHKIVTYIEDFEEIDKEQDKQHQETIEEYKKYVDLFSQNSFQIFFEDFENLGKLMGKLAIPVQDRALILKHLALQNMKVVNPDLSIATEEYLNYASHVQIFLIKCSNNYTTEEEKKILNLIHQDVVQIDVDLIPSIAEELAKDYGINSEVIKQVILANILKNIFEEYKKATADESIEMMAFYKEQMDAILKYESKIKNATIVKAKDLLKNNPQMCELILEFGTLVKNFEEKLVSEIEKEYEIDHELALQFKSMPIVQEISNTLDHLKILDPRDDFYQEGLQLLEALLKEYEELNKPAVIRKK